MLQIWKRLTFIFDTVCLETFYSLRWNLIKITTFWASFKTLHSLLYINTKCGLKEVKIVTLCTVTVTADSQKTFEKFYMILPYHVIVVILTTSELLSGCFNQTTYAEMVLDLVSRECRIMQKVNLAWKRCHLTCDSVGALIYAAVRCYAMRCAMVRISPYLDLF